MANDTLKRLKEYLIFYYKKHKLFPSNLEAGDFMNLSPENLQKYYKFLIKNEFIKREGKRWIIPKDIINNYYPVNKDPDEELPQYEDVEEPIIDIPFDKKFKQKRDKQRAKERVKARRSKHIGNIILKIFLLIIGSGATYMSIMYSAKWFMSFLNTGNALLLAFIMVVYAVGSFELIIYFYIDNKKIIAGVFSILWICVTAFSMVSTIAGQYNSCMDEIKEQYSEDNKIFQNNNQVQDWNAEAEIIQNELKVIDTELNRIQDALLQFRTLEQINENRRLYNSLYWQRNQATKSKTQILEKWNELVSRKPKAILEKKESDFYQWISEVVGFTSDQIQFWLSLFPALFIDLIAPLSFAAVLYIKE